MAIDTSKKQNNFIARNPGLLLGTAIILSTIIASYTFYQTRSLWDELSVTGSVRTAVVSDTVKWTAVFNRTTKLSALKSGYSKIDSDLVQVKNFLTAKGIKADEIDISPVFMDQVYDYNPATSSGTDKEYVLRQNVEINSKDVTRVTNVAKNTQELIEKGVIFSTTGIEYSYSKLSELRVSLLGSAIQDAQARASKIAESGGKRIGSLRSASSGVVQVLSKNSNEINDYGSYDMSKIEKDIMLTVKASFALK